jgi:MarR family transcriptional regulator, negative regulator of the multidrug operon emrRAB
MHSADERIGNARTANLLGALTLEAAHLQQEAGEGVVGIGGAAAAALVTIQARPGWTIEQMRGGLGLTQPGAARLVERLTQAGLVERFGPGGRRGYELRLTARGEEVLEQLFLVRRAALTELLAPLSDDDQARLGELLELLLAGRIGDRGDLERVCRLCERRCCVQCPVREAYESGATDG